MTDARVTVDCWVNTYVVPGTQASSRASLALQDLRPRIDQRVAEELAASCGGWLQHCLDPASPAVWRIRELDLSFLVDVSAPASTNVCQRWGERVANRISEVIERGPQRDRVLFFETRATYLAQFALDLISGSAWDKWYYEEFRSLELLTISRALAEALTAEPEHGWSTLLHLARSARLEDLLQTLSDGDAGLIYNRCSVGDASASSSDLSVWCGRLLEIWNDTPLRPASTRHHDALRWLTAVALRYPGPEQDATARAAIDRLLELRRILASFGSALAADRIVSNLVDQRLSLEDAITAAHNRDIESPESGLRFLLNVAQGDSHWAAQMTSALLRDATSALFRESAPESLLSPFGGIFLLCTAFVELGLAEIALDAALDPENEPAASSVRHLVIAKCLGPEHTREALSDPAVRLLSGHDAPILHGFPAALDLGPAQAVFARNLARSAPHEAHILLAQAVPLPAANLDGFVLLDTASNEWIYTSLLPPALAAREQAILTALDLVRESTGNTPSLLLLSKDLAPLAESRALQNKTVHLITLSEQELPELPSGKLRHLLASTERDLTFLSLLANPDLHLTLDPALDLLSAMLARGALKAFARRLVGFQSSSPEYLARNFLQGLSSVRCLPDRIEVDLPRPPLSLVLQISGLLRQTFRVPWLHEREVWLLPPRD
jgi:hypothetical protein